MKAKRHLRITFVCRSENQSGGQQVISIYADRLARLGHEVTVIIPKGEPVGIRDRARALIKENVWIGRRLERSASFFRSPCFTVCRLAHRGPVTNLDLPDGDVVIASWWETAEWVSVLDPSKGAKVYFIQHHEIHDFLPADRVKATYRLPFHKIVVATWLKRLMNEQYGDAIVDHVPNSVERSQFFSEMRGKQPVPSIGFLYATATFKGLDQVLAALQIVKRRISDLRCVSFGAQKPIRRLPLPQFAEFHHSPAQYEIRRLYGRCDAWVTASRSEGFNLPALEAMACRTPVVSTRTGWPEEAVKSGWNGVLADVDDVYGLAQGIEWVLTRDDRDWRRLSNNAFETASTGSWDESAVMFEAALKKAYRRAVRGEISGNFTQA